MHLSIELTLRLSFVSIQDLIPYDNLFSWQKIGTDITPNTNFTQLIILGGRESSLMERKEKGKNIKYLCFFVWKERENIFINVNKKRE